MNICRILNKIIIAIAIFNLLTNTIYAANPASLSLKVKPVIITDKSRISADLLLKNNVNYNSDLKEKLSNISLGVITEPLGELTLSKKQIKRQLGILAHNLILPNQIVFKRQGYILKYDEIVKKINKICMADLGNSKNVNIDFSRIPNHLVLPGNVKNWYITPTSTNKLGMRLFQLHADTDSGKFRKLLQIQVSMTLTVACLKRLAKPGEILTKELVKPKQIQVKNMRARLPLSFKDTLGKSLTHYKSPGTIIRAADVKEIKGVKLAVRHKIHHTRTNCYMAEASKKSLSRDNWLIKPGEQVNFSVKKGRICLSLPARALQGGNLGDRISLINLKNHRKITGTIVAEGKVEYE